MTEKKDVPSSIAVPGAYEKTGNYTSTFIAPIQRMLNDRTIKQWAPRLFQVMDDEIRIEDSQGRVEILLDKGTFIVSITWDFNQEWHTCHIDWSRKRS